MIKIRRVWNEFIWYARRLYNFLVLIMTGTIAFEGAGAIRGLKPSDLASAKIVIAMGNHRFIEIKTKDGEIITVVVTPNNIGAIAAYVEVVEPVVLNDELRYQECDESTKLFELRKENKLKYGW